MALLRCNRIIHPSIGFMAPLLLALRRSAATTSLFNRLINRGNHVPQPSSSRATFFTSSSDTVAVYSYANGEEFRRCLDEFPLYRGSADANMENPFQITGPPRGWYEVKRVDEGLFVRIEMPGIAKEDVKVTAEYGNLYVMGQGRKECPLETTGRGYGGHIEFPADSYREKDMKHELKNGVLRVFIPKKVDKEWSF